MDIKVLSDTIYQTGFMMYILHIAVNILIFATFYLPILL